MNNQGVIGLEPNDVAVDGGRHGHPHLLLVIGSRQPGPRALRSVAWLGRRLTAEILVVGAVEYRPPRDELVGIRVDITRGEVAATAKRLADDGVSASGTVVLAPDGRVPAAVDDLADEQEADLIAVAARRRSWFWVFPGSLVAHHLTRDGRWPVLVIPDHGPGLVSRARSWVTSLTGC